MFARVHFVVERQRLTVPVVAVVRRGEVAASRCRTNRCRVVAAITPWRDVGWQSEIEVLAGLTKVTVIRTVTVSSSLR